MTSVYKVVWINGDETYIEAESSEDARRIAAPSRPNVRIIYCAVYA